MFKVKDILNLLPQGEWVELMENDDENLMYYGVKEEVPQYITECEVNKIYPNYDLAIVIEYEIEKW